MIEVKKESKEPLTDDTTYALIEGLLPQLDQNEKLNFGYMNPVEKQSIVTMKYKGGGTCDGSFSTIEECVFDGKFTAVETYLGVKNLDNRWMKHFVQEFNRKNDDNYNKFYGVL